MSDSTFRAYYETRIASLVSSSEYPTTRIKFEGAVFVQPTNQMFAIVNVIDGDPFNTNIGSIKRIRNVGIVQIDILAPKDAPSGLTNARKLAQHLKEGLQNKNTVLSDGDTVQFRAGGIKQGLYGEEYVGRMVQVPFWRHETVTD